MRPAASTKDANCGPHPYRAKSDVSVTIGHGSTGVAMRRYGSAMSMASIGFEVVASPHAQWWALLASWGNIGSFLGGLAAVGLAVIAVISGTAGLGDWRAKQRAQRDLANEEAENIRLDRQRVLYGWTPGGLEVYGVRLVTQPAELQQAAVQLSEVRPSDYIVLQVIERPDGNENRAHNLRQMVERTGFVTRPPERGEYEALQSGRAAMLNPNQ